MTFRNQFSRFHDSTLGVEEGTQPSPVNQLAPAKRHTIFNSMPESIPIGKPERGLVRRNTPVSQTDIAKVYADGNPDDLINATTAVTQAIGPDNKYLADTFGVKPNGLPYNVHVGFSNGEGASHLRCDSTTFQVAVTKSDAQLAAAFTTAEIVEVYEAVIKNGWDCGRSNGEGISRMLALQLHSDLKPLLTKPVTHWLQHGACDCISTNDANDRNADSNGCSVVFLDYLNQGLGYSWKDIVRTGGNTLAETYSKLTGDDSSTAYRNFMEALPSFTNGNFTDALSPFVNGSQLALPEKGHFSCTPPDHTKEIIGGSVGGGVGLLALGAVAYQGVEY